MYYQHSCSCDFEVSQIPAKNARACMNVEIRRAAVVRVLNNRGGTIGERVVKTSLIPAPINITKPTTRGAIV